jgi:hypothetical protein
MKYFSAWWEAIGRDAIGELVWRHSLGAIYYGSGDRVDAARPIHTFTTLYPLGHDCRGQIDIFSGQNPVAQSSSLAPPAVCHDVWLDSRCRVAEIWQVATKALGYLL